MTLPSIIHGDLPGAVFDFEFYNGTSYHCCAMRATFTFDADGELDILEDQPPMMFGDYFDPDTSGAVFDNLMATAELLYPSDTTPYKPATDVLVVGTAQSKFHDRVIAGFFANAGRFGSDKGLVIDDGQHGRLN